MDPDGERDPGAGQAALIAGVVAEVIGIVTEQLPSALYRIRLEAGGFVTAHVADRIDRNFVRVLVGDRVRIELSPVDITRGRIVAKV